jgi:hypothetical protein
MLQGSALSTSSYVRKARVQVQPNGASPTVKATLLFAVNPRHKTFEHGKPLADRDIVRVTRVIFGEQ